MKPRIILALIVLCGVSLWAQTPAALADAQKALGGELPGSLKNFSAKGVRRNIIAGQPATAIPFEWHFELPDKFVWIEGGADRVVIGFNGKKVVTNSPENLFDMGGYPEDRNAIVRDDEKLANARVNFAIVSLGVFAREFRQAFPMEFFKNVGDTDAVTIEADQLSATFKLDPITHLPSQLGWRQQGRGGLGGALVTRLWVYSNYRDVDARKVPGRLAFYLGQAKTDKLQEMARWDLQSFQWNAPIDSKVFAPAK
ncbi:MAG: hypothetical protein KA205_09270 [Acidobacteria bacterium]|nr:hypothetical protein [Acidobacteriota bacterium]